MLQKNGYQTAVVGKWHKKRTCRFVIIKFSGQKYINPLFKTKENWEDGYKGGVEESGFSADIIGDSSIDWLKKRDPNKPFFLMTHFKATHEPFDYPERNKNFLKGITIPEPESLYDFLPSKSNRSFEGQH